MKKITLSEIQQLLAEKMEDTDIFLVECTVSVGNDIYIEVDSPSGMMVKDFVSVSRHIEGNYDRDLVDFGLQVSSPGLTNPFKVYEQYLKNVGRGITVNQIDGAKIEGDHIQTEKEFIVVKTRKKERIEGRKAKQWVEEEIKIPMENIKEAKTVISFKK